MTQTYSTHATHDLYRPDSKEVISLTIPAPSLELYLRKGFVLLGSRPEGSERPEYDIPAAAPPTGAKKRG